MSKGQPPSVRKADPVAQAAPFIEQREFGKAEAILRKGAFTHGRDPAVFGALCHVLAEQGKAPEVEFFAREGLKVAPAHPGLSAHLAKSLRVRQKHAEARRVLDDAMRLHPANLELAMELGELLVDTNDWIEAVELADRAIKEGWAADPILRMRATVMHKLGRLREAVAFIRGAQWHDGHGIDPAHAVATMLNYDDGTTAEQVAAAHRRYGMLMTDHYGALRRTHPPCTGPERALRIGVISPDFRQHSVAYFAAPFVAALRAAGHHVTAYGSAHNEDEWTAVFRQRASVFRRVAGMTLPAIADLIQADQIDVLFELSGLTTGHAQQVMVLKPAPVQCSYIGYPSTTGLDAIDFRLVDALTDPPEPRYDALCTERLIRMDGPFLCYEPAMQHVPPVRLGPPPGDRPFTFGSFNALHKVNDCTLRLWAGVLRAVPGSRLAVKMARTADSRTARAVVQRFVDAGMDESRVLWMGHTKGTREHLATYDGIDVALDTFPYHGTTTTCEALLMGVPVVSLTGDRHAARVGLALLTAAGLPDLAAHDEHEFVCTAAALAGDAARLGALRAELRERVLRGPLGDQTAYGGRLGKAVRAMWRQACAR